MHERPLGPGTVLLVDQHPEVITTAIYSGFVDCDPGKNWGHRCRYVRCVIENDTVEVTEARFPPTVEGQRLAWVVQFVGREETEGSHSEYRRAVVCTRASARSTHFHFQPSSISVVAMLPRTDEASEGDAARRQAGQLGRTDTGSLNEVGPTLGRGVEPCHRRGVHE